MKNFTLYLQFYFYLATMQNIFHNWNFRIEIRLRIAFELHLYYTDEFLISGIIFQMIMFRFVLFLNPYERSVFSKYKIKRKRIKNYRPVFWLSEGRPGLYCRIGTVDFSVIFHL